jgi:hypothetical protein
MDIPTRRLKLNGTVETTDVEAVWQAAPLNFEVGLFIDEETPEDDFANVESFMLMLSRDRSEFTAVASKTVLKAEMDDETITLAEWDAGTHQHVTFEMTSADMNFPLLDADERFWFSIITTLDTGDMIVSGGGWIEVRECGTAGGPTAPGQDVYSIVTDSGGVEWQKISRVGQPDKYVQLFSSIP